jgi:hypothetical protein
VECILADVGVPKGKTVFMEVVAKLTQEPFNQIHVSGPAFASLETTAKRSCTALNKVIDDLVAADTKLCKRVRKAEVSDAMDQVRALRKACRSLMTVLVEVVRPEFEIAKVTACIDNLRSSHGVDLGLFVTSRLRIQTAKDLVRCGNMEQFGALMATPPDCKLADQCQHAETNATAVEVILSKLMGSASHQDLGTTKKIAQKIHIFTGQCVALAETALPLAIRGELLALHNATNCEEEEEEPGVTDISIGTGRTGLRCRAIELLVLLLVCCIMSMRMFRPAHIF